ncbi:hypothetical protein Peur_041506 [Populus x canadensis]|jgi:hypothetical protein
MDGYQAFGVLRYEFLAIFCMLNVEVRFGPVSTKRKPDFVSTVAVRGLTGGFTCSHHQETPDDEAIFIARCFSSSS